MARRAAGGIVTGRDWSRPETLQDRIDRDGVDEALGLIRYEART